MVVTSMIGPVTFRFLRIRMQRYMRALAVLLMILPALAQQPAQDKTRRLILKDGSYQLITKYEVKGQRVRYYSSEREDWEELPYSLVDWTATEQYEKDRAAAATAPAAVELEKESEKDQPEIADSDQPQVAPGLHLPEGSGVFLLDTFQGEPQLDEIQQTAGDVTRSAKGNIFRDAMTPIAGAKAVISLDGAHAAVQSHVDVPAIYINPEDASGQPDQANMPDQQRIHLDAPRDSQTRGDQPQQPQQPQQPEQPRVPLDRFRIVRIEIKGGNRIIGEIKRSASGKVTQDQRFAKTTITSVKGGWLKLTPAESLAPGEYAVVEMMGKEGMNLYVWDFGVNPKAPENANPWKAEKKSAPDAVNK
jgi:hypothetical protein